jgi:hypothetical protein
VRKIYSSKLVQKFFLLKIGQKSEFSFSFSAKDPDTIQNPDPQTLLNWDSIKINNPDTSMIQHQSLCSNDLFFWQPLLHHDVDW